MKLTYIFSRKAFSKIKQKENAHKAQIAGYGVLAR